MPGAKLSEIEQDLSSLRVCYDLTPTGLKKNAICPHCHFSLEDKAQNVYGQLDNIEDRIDGLAAEWTKMLLDTISDPLVLSQKEYLSPKQAQVIDEFVSSIQALLKNYEPVVIEVEDLLQKLEQLPPMDEAGFKQKLNEMISAHTKGKYASTLRIVVKRKESED